MSAVRVYENGVEVQPTGQELSHINDIRGQLDMEPRVEQRPEMVSREAVSDTPEVSEDFRYYEHPHNLNRAELATDPENPTLQEQAEVFKVQFVRDVNAVLERDEPSQERTQEQDFDMSR